MRLQLLPAVPGVVSLTSVGFHYSSNMAFVYSIFGFDIHLLTVALSMLGIHIFIFLRELGRVRIEGRWTNVALNAIDILLQGLVLVPFFVTSKGGIIKLSETDGAFWIHFGFVAFGILLFRFVVFLFTHCIFVNSNPTE